MWQRVTKFDPRSAALADGHYSRRKIGAPQFMPPGKTLILLTDDERAVFGWWRPDPASGIRQMNGKDGWTCTIFRNTGAGLSSELILLAERALQETGCDCGPDGLLSYVWRAKVRSSNPGCCFKKAGWKKIGISADKRKDLLWKPWALAGVAPFRPATVDGRAVLSGPETTAPQSRGSVTENLEAPARGRSNL